MIHKIVNFLTWFITALIATMFIILAFEKPILQINDLKKELVIEDNLLLINASREICSSKAIVARVERKVVNLKTSAVFRMADGIIDIKRGCNTIRSSFYLPVVLPSGTYGVDVLLKYKLNLLKTEYYAIPTFVFTKED